MVRMKSPRFGACFIVLLVSAAMLMLCTKPLPAREQYGSSPGFTLKKPSRFLIGAHFGMNMPQAKGDLFSLLTNTLTLQKSDFRAPDFGFDVGIPFRSRVAIIAGFDYNRFTRDSEFRHFVESNGNPIVQTTRFSQFSFVGTIRYYLLETGESVGSYAWIPARVSPYLAAGGGIIHYNLSQYGDFVDQSTYNIFSDHYFSGASSLAKHLAAGFDIAITPRVVATVEGRYSWAGAGISSGKDGGAPDYRFPKDPSGNSQGSPVDLGGLKLIGGIYFRY
jgi:hypothetical protein